MNSEILPKLRRLVARELKEKGFSQKKISEILGISQGMVSRYLKEEIEAEEEFLNFSKQFCENIEMEEKDLILFLCQTCFSWRENRFFCKFCRENCDICVKLRSVEVVGGRAKILGNLRRAIFLIGKNKDFLKLMPQIRINVAEATEKPQTSMDVASIPGRLVPVKEKIIAPAEPEFGVSGTLSKLLIKVSKKNPELKSVMNVKFNQEIFEALKKCCFKFTREVDEIEDCLIEEGFGIEPCLYIFGKDSIDVVFKAEKILKGME